MASAPTSERAHTRTALRLEATKRLGRDLDAPARQARQRSLTSYLLLPRPKDLGKGWLLVATFGLGALAAGGADAHSALRVLVVWPVLELLIYQARYQWNDIAGFEADQCHPDAATRGRLPGPPARARRHKLLSAAVAAARLLLALGIAAAFASLHLLGLVSVLIVAVFGLAAAYEKAKRLATARSMTTAQSVSRSVLGLWA